MNVYDIKKRNKLNIVLPKSFSKNMQGQSKKKCAVFIHFYYENIESYIPYITNIPKEMDIYFSYSNQRIKNKIDQIMKVKTNKVTFVKKENRGRDISALLVAFRKYYKDYEYICFLHDKKEKTQERKQDIEKWIYSLWENMLGSEEYITNIINSFIENDELGMLVPPLQVSERIAHAYTNRWMNNYENTQRLSNDLGLKCELDESKAPIALGTVFWARVVSLRKLFEKEWAYNDFEEEPIKDDAEINHAIERILPYVVQDVGYHTGWVMTDSFAAEYIETLRDSLERSYQVLDDTLGISFGAELTLYDKKKNLIKSFVLENENIYIYGAGKYGESCFKMMASMGFYPKGFLISGNPGENHTLLNTRINNIDDVEFSEKDGIIIAASAEFAKEITDNLNRRKITASRFIYDRMSE